MDEIDHSKEMILEYTKVIAKESYNDLLHHSLSTLGDLGGNILQTVLLPLTPFYYGGGSFKRLKRYFTELGERVPENRRQDASIAFLGKGFESLKWIEEESILENMFLDLISAGIDKDRDYCAHPAFFEILEKLSPDEAMILKFMQSSPIYEESIKESPTYKNRGMPNYISKKIKSVNLPLSDLIIPDNYFIYMQNLTFYNLIEVSFPPDTNNIINQTTEIITSLDKWNYYFSDFGKLFSEACIHSKDEKEKSHA